VVHRTANDRDEARSPVTARLLLQEIKHPEEWYFKFGAAARFRSLARELAEKIATLFEDSSS
jgi:hypothetical protein